MPDEGINPEELPSEAAHVWHWFLELHESRSQGMNGPQPITNLEILAYAGLTGIQFEGWELAAMRRLDRLALNPPEEAK